MRPLSLAIVLAVFAAEACSRPAEISGNWADSETNGRALLLRIEKAGTFESHVASGLGAHIENGKYVLSSQGNKTLMIRTFESRHNTDEAGRRLMTVDTVFASLSSDDDVLTLYDRCDFGTEKSPKTFKRVTDDVMLTLSQRARAAVFEEMRNQHLLESGALGSLFRRKPGRGC